MVESGRKWRKVVKSGENLEKVLQLKNMAVIQSRPTHIIHQCAKFGDNRVI